MAAGSNPVRPSIMETLEVWVQELKKCNKLIIVEGKNDKKALEDLGINNIITFSNSPLLSIENIKEQEVVILTDIDKAGRKMYSILKQELQKRKVKVDDRFRKFLFYTRISHIEGITL